jgi:hypothetical protein
LQWLDAGGPHAENVLVQAIARSILIRRFCASGFLIATRLRRLTARSLRD